MGFGFPLDIIVAFVLLVGLLLVGTESFFCAMRFFRKETNGDHIRNMTDEELSKFLSCEMNIACYYCDRCVCRGGDLECKSCRSTDMESILLSWFSKEHVPGSDDVREDHE